MLACTAVTPGKNGLTRQSAIDLAANQRPAASVPWALQCHHKQSTTPRQVCWGSTGHVSLLCMRSACPDALCFHTAWAISVLLRSQVLSQQSSACSLPRRSEGTDVCYMKDLPYVFTAAGTLSCSRAAVPSAAAALKPHEPISPHAMQVGHCRPTLKQAMLQVLMYCM